MNRRIEIRLLGSDDRILDQSIQDIVDTIKRIGAKVSGPIPVPFTVHSSKRIKNRIYQRKIYIIDFSENMVNELKKLNLPSSVEIQIKL